VPTLSVLKETHLSEQQRAAAQWLQMTHAARCWMYQRSMDAEYTKLIILNFRESSSMSGKAFDCHCSLHGNHFKSMLYLIGYVEACN